MSPSRGSSAAAGVPSPGGLGSVDAALVVALVSAGSPIGIATSTVLGCRIIMVCLPLLPRGVDARHARPPDAPNPAVCLPPHGVPLLGGPL
ncbi:hypothetical protein [Streptomyces sp. NBC_01190]|uniref:hypothetical protein n=1 Tax=Streptomyces sp. NBC_01190 TaxID=2903767 RepID=UPI0038698993|nr:hypothetical protein OG519_24530 [Streptomyces sp. NBC_01190]